MRSSWLLFGACAVVCIAAGSCGDGGGQTDGGFVDSGPEGAAPSPFGLDSRVPNPTCVAPDRPPAPGGVVMQQVFPNLTLAAPMTMHQIPGDASRYFVAQRAGTLVSFATSDPSDNTKTTVLTIPQTVNTNGEGGFLGFAFHPKFAQNGYVFISYTGNSATAASGMKSVVARMTSADGGKTFANYVELFSFDQPFTNHKGGDAHFGTDGYLYLSFGDGGSGGDPYSHGQNTNLYFSKILRIDVDSTQNGNYGIPSTNPFATGGGQPETFAYGFRNPFRFTIDRATGEPWVADVGQNLWEEVDPQVKLGGNYGWNIMEGTHCYNAQTCNEAGLIQPIYDYPHQNGDNCVIGAVVYRGALLPSFVGGFLFGDNGSGRVWTMTIGTDGKPVVTEIGNGGGSGWSAFVDDEAGEAFGLSVYTGKVYQLVANGPPPTSTFPDKLSKTGCFDPNDPTKPLPMLVPYGVNSTLWSDGAQKARWFALPDGKTIAVGPDGDFDLPVGSIAIKEFSLGGKRVETRLMVHHTDGDWAGYTYEWNDQGTDATLLPSSDTKTIGTQTWYIPSRPECMRCHTTASGRTLGLELGQLNGDFVYTSTNRVSNQIATLDHIGMFTASPGNPTSLVKFPTPTDTSTGTLEDRARSYLHANCSICHRPNGGGGSNMDWRWATPFGNTNACNVAPVDGDLGITGAMLMLPGAPDKSLIVQRPRRLDANRMPPLASHVVDDTGTQVLNDWVAGVTACAAPVDAGTDQ